MAQPTRRPRTLLIGLILLLVPGLAGADVRPFDRWYVVELAGQRSGWMHSTLSHEGETVVAETSLKLEIRRGQTEITIAMDSRFEETEAGTPIRMRTTMQLGTVPMETSVTYGDGTYEMTSSQAGRTTTTSGALPDGVWFTPGAAERFVRARLDAGAEEIEARVLDPQSGITAIVMNRRIASRQPVEALGKTVPGIKWITTVDSAPGLESVEYVDLFGAPVRTETDLGAFKFTTILADRAIALADADPPELLVQTFVRPSEPIKAPRSTRTALYELRVDDGAMPDLANASAQRVERVDSQTVRVTVDLSRVAPAPESETDDPVFREPSQMIDSADTEIVALVERTLKNAPDRVSERAERLRRTAHRFISGKSLDVGLATASEVVRTKTGDCSEHAMLLAAMLRADGIPSRVASGLIYADAFAGEREIFGYHMWTQAIVPDDQGVARWVDLDATLGRNTPTDATHIALAVSAMEDGTISNALVELVPLFGRLSVDVQRVSP